MIKTAPHFFLFPPTSSSSSWADHFNDGSDKNVLKNLHLGQDNNANESHC